MSCATGDRLCGVPQVLIDQVSIEVHRQRSRGVCRDPLHRYVSDMTTTANRLADIGLPGDGPAMPRMMSMAAKGVAQKRSPSLISPKPRVVPNPPPSPTFCGSPAF
jgi:hypothetical protein